MQPWIYLLGMDVQERLAIIVDHADHSRLHACENALCSLSFAQVVVCMHTLASNVHTVWVDMCIQALCLLSGA